MRLSKVKRFRILFSHKLEQGLCYAFFQIDDAHCERVLPEVQIVELLHPLHVAISSHQLIGSRDTLPPASAVLPCSKRLLTHTIDVQWLIDTRDGAGGQEAAGQEVGVLAVALAGEEQAIVQQELTPEKEAHREGDEMQEEVSFLAGCELSGGQHGVAMHLAVALTATVFELAVGKVIESGMWRE